ncbi:hypothetical protein HanIR_Chr08g0385321 [Helianthus annuus]|nr:hypothetical protein HanIR_Chr08g0385321 [Helianthus annuus]
MVIVVTVPLLPRTELIPDIGHRFGIGTNIRINTSTHFYGGIVLGILFFFLH